MQNKKCAADLFCSQVCCALENVLVDGTDLWALHILPDGVIVLRESLLKQLIAQFYSVQVTALMLVQAER